jgi:coenzyme F420-reducing hydrogenase delta subunit
MRYVTTESAFEIRKRLYDAMDIAGRSEADTRALVCRAFQTITRGKIRREIPMRAFTKGHDVIVWRVVGAWCGCVRFGQYVQGIEAVYVSKVCPRCIIGINGERVPYDSIVGFTLDEGVKA